MSGTIRTYDAGGGGARRCIANIRQDRREHRGKRQCQGPRSRSSSSTIPLVNNDRVTGAHGAGAGERAGRRRRGPQRALLARRKTSPSCSTEVAGPLLRPRRRAALTREPAKAAPEPQPEFFFVGREGAGGRRAAPLAMVTVNYLAAAKTD